MEEEKVGETQSRFSLRRDVIRDINYLNSKGMITNKEVYYLIKNFLRKYLNLNYEFTKDELFEELKSVYLPYNIRSDFFKFIEQIFVFEYSDVTYNDEELKILLNQFKSYIDYLLVAPHDRGKKVGQIVIRNWKDKIKNYFKKSKILVDKTVVVQNKPIENISLVVSNNDSFDVKFKSMIEKIYDSIYNDDLVSAIDLYKKVISKYESMSQEEKGVHYELLTSVYNSIKNSDVS